MTAPLDQTRSVRPGEELDLSKLEPWLRERFGDAPGKAVVEQFPSGHSNLTYLVRWGDHELVLRRPPFGSEVRSAHDMGREFRVLSKLYQAYPPAPQPLGYDETGAVLGAPFYVMRRIKGVILRKDPPEGLELPPDLVRRMGESFLDNLATLHGIDYAAIGLADLGKPVGYVERQVNGWIRRYYGSQTDDLPEVEPISKWLTANMPAESGAALVHNDYKFDNVVLAASDLTRIAGVLDWEMSTIGDPLMDLGTAISYWIDTADPPDLQLIRWGPTTLPGSLTRAELTARYAEQTGRDVSQMPFYLAFAYFKTAVIAQQIYYRFHKGLTQDARFAFFIEATKILLRAAQRTIETGRL
ncbi:MAG: phosphotransferase family protein [Pirellulales bacterium]